MGRPLSEWRNRINEILADGEWHEQDSVVRDAMRFVPPGPAFRHAEKSRIRLSPNAKTRTRGDESDAIASGQRQITMQAVHAALRFNKIERKQGDDGKTYLRRPDVAPPQQSQSEDDDLVAELKQQITYWERTKRILPEGDVRTLILGGDPIASIEAVLRKHGRL